MHIKKVLFCLIILVTTKVNAMSYLFGKFPALQDKISYIKFCDLPTPIEQLHNFGALIGCKNIFMKRDDLTGKNLGNGLRLYGGNKPRKLEFLLADAIHKNAHTIITYGCAGSNHALATATYAHELGLSSILMLKNQPNSHIVRHNLLLDQYYDAQLQFFPNNQVRDLASQALLDSDNSIYLIPTGGSTPIGALGYVNAAFELADQIAKHEIDVPDLIYVATGSCATVAGLLLGLQVANVQSKIIAVCVEPLDHDAAILSTIQRLFSQTNSMLHDFDVSFPLIQFPENNVIINKNFCGIEYGLFTPEAVAAITLFYETEKIKLEGTYSAKPIAAIMQDAAQQDMQHQTILFWNTYCGIDFSYLTHFDDYKQLPKEFWKYFEQEVQSLDQINQIMMQ